MKSANRKIRGDQAKTWKSPSSVALGLRTKTVLLGAAIAAFSVILGLLAVEQLASTDPGTARANSQRSEVSSPASDPTAPKQKAAPNSTTQPQKDPKPNDPTALNQDLQTIFRFIEARDTGTARVRLKKYLKLHPNDGKATFLFGLTYHREKKYGQAIEYYQQAIELQPSYYLTHHFHGWALFYLGDLEQSRAEFERFLKHKPDEPDSHFALGLIALDEDELDDAERLFRRSIELSRAAAKSDFAELSRAHARLGDALERQGKLEEARAELVIAIDLFPDHYEAYYKLYRVLLQMEQTDEAERIHKLYIETKERVRPGTSFAE